MILSADVATDIAVIGAGPAGLVAALAAARTGYVVTIVAPRPSAATLARDTRTFAALGGSVDLLRNLGVWSALAPETTPLKAIRIIDDRGGIFRAPEVVFHAHELGLDAFGANIPQAALAIHLAAAVERAQIRWLDSSVASLASADDHVSLGLATGASLRCHLAVAADGRHSLARAAAGITTTAWSYPQTALACTFTHARPHAGISTELHRAHGPLTTVPMPDLDASPGSSLVWVEAPVAADQLQGLTDAGFAAALENRLQGLLGRVGSVGPRASFPLVGIEADTMAQHRIALVGEAGHVLPPIGAQGLNLGFRDAACLADVITDAGGADPGAASTLAAYARARHADIWTRTRAVDALNRSLLTGLLPLDALRGAGLHALAASAVLRRTAMQRGLEPIGARPRLMQPPLAANPATADCATGGPQR